jgi:hypothetical protein
MSRTSTTSGFAPMSCMFCDNGKRCLQVGKHPKVFVFHSFLTDEERQHMLSLAAPHMKRSTVVGQGGGGVVDNIRTSYGKAQATAWLLYSRKQSDAAKSDGVEHSVASVQDAR